jgi:hypothetical protein
MEQDIVARNIALIYKTLPKCGLGDPRRAFVTAAHYFHRYCVVESIEEEPRPEAIAMACLFIAGKTEEVPWPRYSHGSLQNRGFTARNICAAMPSVTIDDLIEYERQVLHAIDFCLVVHQPKACPEKGSDEELRETVFLMATRACLVNSPSELRRLVQAVDLAQMSEFVDLASA